MKWLTMFAVLFLAGCGGSSSQQNNNPPPTQSATMKAGQWELVATPSAGGEPVYLEANLTVGTGNGASSVYSSNLNTQLFQNSAAPGHGADGQGLFSACSNWAVDATTSNNTLSGDAYNPGGSGAHPMTFSATVSSGGQSVSGGTYTSTNSLCLWEPGPTTGTFTGYVVPPLNGTFTGILTGTSSGPDQFAIQITQDSNFGITASGTSVRNGVTSNLSFSPSVSSNNIIGALMTIDGTETNINGSWHYQVFGHFNPAGTQITVATSGQMGYESGTLTKQ